MNLDIYIQFYYIFEYINNFYSNITFKTKAFHKSTNLNEKRVYKNFWTINDNLNSFSVIIITKISSSTFSLFS